MKSRPSIKTKSTGGKEFDPVPAGTHFAYCTQLIDLGKQLTTYEGQERERQEVYLRFEVPEERMSYVKDGKEVSGPMTIGATFTNSIGEKSKLRPMLESWRGKPFTPEELEGFELTSVVGKPCQISVTHKPKQGGGVYANITAILGISKLQRSAMNEGKLPKEPEGELLVYTPMEHDDEVFEKLPKWLQEKIEKRIVDEAPDDVPSTQVEKAADEDFDDEIPFN